MACRRTGYLKPAFCGRYSRPTCKAQGPWGCHARGLGYIPAIEPSAEPRAGICGDREGPVAADYIRFLRRNRLGLFGTKFCFLGSVFESEESP